MAFAPGYKAWFALDNASGSLTVLQPYIDNISIPQTVQQLEVSMIGTAAKAFIVGLTDGDQITVSGAYDPAVTTHLGALKAAQSAGTASHSWMYGPGGSVSAQAKISGECLLASYTPAAQVGGRTEWSATLQITGAVTNATF